MGSTRSTSIILALVTLLFTGGIGTAAAIELDLPDVGDILDNDDTTSKCLVARKNIIDARVALGEALAANDDGSANNTEAENKAINDATSALALRITLGRSACKTPSTTPTSTPTTTTPTSAPTTSSTPPPTTVINNYNLTRRTTVTVAPRSNRNFSAIPEGAPETGGGPVE